MPDVKLFTQTQPLIIVQTAQYLGARLLKTPFFPPWMVNQFAQNKLITVERETDKITGKPSALATVRVWSQDKKKSEAMTVKAPLKKQKLAKNG